MTTMHVSYAEMMRMAPEVLRMLGGLPYGLAVEAIEALMMTHAALGKAYALTRLSASGSPGPWSPRLLQSDDATLAVDCGGAPLVLYAGILADAASVKRDCRRLIVTGINGGWLLPYLVHRLSGRGLACRATWIPPADRPRDEAPPLTVVSGMRGKVILAETVVEGAGQPGILVELGEYITPPDGARIIDFDEAVQHFMAEGRETDAEEHRRDYTSVAARIRVAYSDRSRTQAG